MSIFTLKLGEWRGQREVVSETVMRLLNPEDIFSATYTNSEGVRVHLLFNFFSSEATFGGPHSPRNCLPGSGWVIQESRENQLVIDGKVIPANRFDLWLRDSRQVMDFWYITHYGETANDYIFKIYELMGSLAFRPRDIAFVRFVADRDDKSLAALKEFEQLFTKEIYASLPFDK